MKRNSSSIFIESPGSTTPLPWLGDEPDFAGFTEPTLSVLQRAWADFLASGEELEIIPDLEQVELPPSPDWQAFRLSLLQSQSFRDWSEQLPDTWREDLKLSAIAANPEALQGLYNHCATLNIPGYTSTSEWQQIADENHIPVKFDAP